MNKLLEGVTVLDLTNVLSGPFTGYQMALLGANVIKVETPGAGDLARQLGADSDLNKEKMGTSFLAQNAGKRSISLNLKSAKGKEVLRRLAGNADVILENFRPGVMDRLGVGYNALKDEFPRLVYCAISGFGQTGPLADAPAYDQIIQGRSGVMSITGDEQSAPLRVGYPVCDTIGGMTAAFAIASALVSRNNTGKGCFIDVSMLDSVMVTMGWIVSNQLIAGRSPVPMGNDNFTASPSGAFRTGDGLLNIAANKQEQFEILCDLLGRSDLKTDPRFAEREIRKTNRKALSEILEEELRRGDAAEWERKFNQAGVPAGQVLSVLDALTQDQVQHRGLLMKVLFNKEDLDQTQEITLTRSGFTIDGEQTGVRHGPPRLGQHTDEILLATGYTPANISNLREEGVV
ncbi:CaiB/BaiF CoA transferase family protein [Herbaspirillum lusitanum]|uniref:CaiB/BaiF CoA transferase family protein n=1 Tax=Herbaspirillum lusitanum TaxID=213312 RepID=UPI0002D4904A|nr:CoA transferase [Herbaspirillum lusitanum]